MPGESDDSAWAFDAVNVLKAKVEAVRQAEAAVQARTSELNEERETLEGWSRRLTEKEQALTRAEEELARRRLGVEDGKSELERAQAALTQAQDRLAGNEARLKEWAQSLHAAEQQVIALRDDLKTRQAEAAMKLAQFHDRIVALAKREEAIADREAAVAETLERLKKVSDSVVARESLLAAQVQALGELQGEWLNAVRRREEEMAGALATLGEQAAAQGTEGSQLAGLIDGLQGEVAKIAAQRQGLVARERKVAEFEQSLMAVIGAVRPAAEAAGPEPPVIADAPPAVPTVEVTAVPRAAPEPEPPKPDAAPKPNGTTKSPKARALEKMTRVVELARKAQSTGRDSEELRESIREIRKAYEAKDWEALDARSERALERLDPVTAPSP